MSMKVLSEVQILQVPGGRLWGWPQEAAYLPDENLTVPPVRAEDPTAIHERGIR